MLISVWPWGVATGGIARRPQNFRVSTSVINRNLRSSELPPAARKQLRRCAGKGFRVRTATVKSV